MRRPYIIQMMAFVIVAGACYSCSTSKYPKSEEEIVASIDNQPIYANELNAAIKQELQNEVNFVYEAKKSALKQLIDSKLIQGEAQKNKMTNQEFLEHYTSNKISTLGLDSLLRQYKIATLFPQRGEEMLTVSTSPSSANSPSIGRLKGVIVNELLESLKQKKTIRVYIYPPKNPLRAIHLLSEETSMACYRYNNLRF